MQTLNYKYSTKNGGKIRTIVYTQNKKVKNYTMIQTLYYIIKALRG